MMPRLLPVRVYLASRLSKRKERQELAHRLELELGYEVTSTWLDADPQQDRKSRAIDDLQDILQSNYLIVFTDEGGTNHGLHFEAGYAHALGIPVIVVGDPGGVFYLLAKARVQDEEELFALLPELEAARDAAVREQYLVQGP